MFRLLFVLIAASLLAGCITWRDEPGGFREGDRQELEYHRAQVTDAQDRLIACEEDSNCDDAARIQIRENYARSKLWIENYRFLELRRQLRAENTQLQLGFDTGIDLLSAIGTFSFGGDTNQILSASTGLINSGRQSFEESSYGDQDVIFLVQLMQEMRASIYQEISASLAEPYTDYDLLDFDMDMERYRRAGTIQEAQRVAADVQSEAVNGIREGTLAFE